MVSVWSNLILVCICICLHMSCALKGARAAAQRPCNSHACIIIDCTASSTSLLTCCSAVCCSALRSPVKGLNDVSCEKQPGPDGKTCNKPHCFGWLKCPSGCVVDGVDWAGAACVYDGVSPNYKLCSSAGCPAPAPAPAPAPPSNCPFPMCKKATAGQCTAASCTSGSGCIGECDPFGACKSSSCVSNKLGNNDLNSNDK